jgi:hypothetical protein
VRICDGRYFPVQSRPGMSAAQTCETFCPASETRLYAGTNIDYAIARDGSRYASMQNAYVYRKHVVAGCTCSGRDPFGLAHIDVKDDPTLRRGDVVVTREGLVAFTGDRNQRAGFTPVQSYPGFSRRYRETLSDIRIMPRGQLHAGDRAADHRRGGQRQCNNAQRSTRQIAGHLLGQRQRTAQPRRFNPEHVHQSGQSMPRRPLDHEVRRRFSRTCELGPDACVVGRQ